MKRNNAMAINTNNASRWHVLTADSFIRNHEVLFHRWDYEYGLMLNAVDRVWKITGDGKYYDYIKSNVDRFVDDEGNIRTYKIEEYNLDQINAGRILFIMYDKTGDEKYRKAIGLLRKQLADHPRTLEGGFWHKKIYPYQMWLDGIYMEAPFYAEYAKRYGTTKDFDDVACQVLIIAKRTFDKKTGLFYHGYDESKKQKWADPFTGCSPNFWGRSMGWFVAGMADLMDYLPEDHKNRKEISGIFENAVNALINFQDKTTGTWFQVLDKFDKQGNYLEASSTALITYAIAKGINQKVLDRSLRNIALKAYNGIIEEFVSVDSEGNINLSGICKVAGLGGTPYRDGSYDYYINEPVVTNDYKGVGPFILAGVEIEKLK
jgi:unsaturated rhamnogalacturonyl hydrolase